MPSLLKLKNPFKAPARTSRGDAHTTVDVVSVGPIVEASLGEHGAYTLHNVDPSSQAYTPSLAIRRTVSDTIHELSAASDDECALQQTRKLPEERSTHQKSLLMPRSTKNLTADSGSGLTRHVSLDPAHLTHASYAKHDFMPGNMLLASTASEARASQSTASPPTVDKGKRPMQMVQPASKAVVHQPMVHFNVEQPQKQPSRDPATSSSSSPSNSRRSKGPSHRRSGSGPFLGSSAGPSTAPSTSSTPSRRSSSAASTSRDGRMDGRSASRPPQPRSSSSQCSTPASSRTPPSTSAPSEPSSATKSSSSISVTAEEIMRHLRSRSGSPQGLSAIANLGQLLATMDAMQVQQQGAANRARTGRIRDSASSSLNSGQGSPQRGQQGMDAQTLQSLADVQNLLMAPGAGRTDASAADRANSARIIARAVRQLSCPDPVARQEGLQRIVSLFGEEYGLLITTVVLLVAQLR